MFEFLEGSEEDGMSFVEVEYSVRLGEHTELLGDDDPCLSLQMFTEDLLGDLGSYFGIQGGERVIEQEHVGVRVESTSQGDPCSLSSTESSPSFFDLSSGSFGHREEVLLETGHSGEVVELLSDVVLSEEDVLSDGSGLNEGTLCEVGYFILTLESEFSDVWRDFSEKREQQSCLPTSNCSNHSQ